MPSGDGIIFAGYAWKAWGSAKFNDRLMPDAQRKKTTSLAREDYQSALRCDRCKKAFGQEHWTQRDRSNRQFGHTKLVCQACRAEGFDARNLRAYTCQACGGSFGRRKFNTMMLRRSEDSGGRHLKCLHCCIDVVRCDRCQKAHEKKGSDATGTLPQQG